ncbi:phosphotransferase family protein [Longirhabdus pacifica]|uniref:phosphotransferase family protein n=1 Tax=Longirhabdus pacifica TaxID=2305227 RepID=UPI00100928C1|nr:phosphotransferase [Longirhabdus pacifica]
MQFDENNIIGTGAQADVFLYENHIYKLYRKGYEKAAIFYEAAVTSLVQSNENIRMAGVHEVLQIEDTYALRMDYIPGDTLQQLYEADKQSAARHINTLVTLQCQIQKKSVDLPLTLKHQLHDKILKSSQLDPLQKNKLIKMLEQLPDGNGLCHGDFHWGNIIINDNQLYVIDWIDATVGCVNADACKTYMLFLLHENNLAALYLTMYCAQSGQSKTDVLQWLPVLVGARFSDDIHEEEETLHTWLEDLI